MYVQKAGKRIVPLVFAVLGWMSLRGEETSGDPWPKLEAIKGGDPLPGTDLLTFSGDLSRALVIANDRFLDRQLEGARGRRDSFWEENRETEEEKRLRLSRMLGMDRDTPQTGGDVEYVSTGGEAMPEFTGLTVRRVRWPVWDGLEGEGILVEPVGNSESMGETSLVLAIPDADQAPGELLFGIGKGELTGGYPLLLARAGCRVLVPQLVSREENSYRMTRREWLHRPAFVLGRTLTGYELHILLAGVEALSGPSGDSGVGVIGWGEGGRLALFAGALEPRIDVTAVSGYFGPREGIWKEPAEHMIFGLLESFGDAEIGALLGERKLILETGVTPESAFRIDPEGEPEVLEERPKKNGKPGRFSRFASGEVNAELERLRSLLPREDTLHHLESGEAISDAMIESFLAALGKRKGASPAQEAPVLSDREKGALAELAIQGGKRIAGSIERHTQRSLVEAAADRASYFSELDTGSLEAFEQSVETYRERFRRDVIGDFEMPRQAPRPRSRPFQEGAKTLSFEVVLDVFDEVIAYGILTVPKGFDPESGPGLPVVVCQHGLEGTPQDLVGENKFKAYRAFATRLAEEGYVTFAPQNGYRGFDRFRLQQFKAQSMGRTLFSLMVPQHEQITDWLASLPFVDPDRIAFYGLSYGGKAAMRIPPLVDRYCLSICSGDFNEWVWKNAATDPRSLRYSYVNKGEYEIFEWNLGGTFNYAEMAALICPRPFMVERGHFDGVAPDETVAYEFAKVRNLYQARLGLGSRCEIEWFPGPHAIHGVGTFDFLDRHLRPDP